MKRNFLMLFDKSIDILLGFYLKYVEVRIKQSYGRILLGRIENKGKECKFFGKSTIMNMNNLKLGDYVHIGEGAFLFCKGGITIGNNTQISRNVTIYSANHDIDGSAIPYDNNYICKKVTIGNSVWIGMNVSITPGVTIGDGAIIGMGTVVSRDVLEGEIVVGSSQRVISKRDMLEYENKVQNARFFGKLWPNN